MSIAPVRFLSTYHMIPIRVTYLTHDMDTNLHTLRLNHVNTQRLCQGFSLLTHDRVFPCLEMTGM